MSVPMRVRVPQRNRDDGWSCDELLALYDMRVRLHLPSKVIARQVGRSPRAVDCKIHWLGWTGHRKAPAATGGVPDAEIRTGDAARREFSSHAESHPVALHTGDGRTIPGAVSSAGGSPPAAQRVAPSVAALGNRGTL